MLKTNHDLTTLSDAAKPEKEFGAYKTPTSMAG